MAKIVESTIQYSRKLGNAAFNVDIDEMWRYFALLLAIGIHGFNGDRRAMWGSDELDNFPWLKKMMPRDRFEEITRYFHLPEGPQNIDGKHDPYWKVAPFAEALQKKFRLNWKISRVNTHINIKLLSLMLNMDRCR